MRKLCSLCMAIVLAVGLLPVGAFAAEGTSVDVSTAPQLVEALGDSTVETINIAADFAITAQVEVTRTVTIQGQNHTLAAEGTFPSDRAHAVLVNGAKNVRIHDLTIDSNQIAKGFNTFDDAFVELFNVALKNSKGAGLTVNRSTVAATNLKTSGNSWGAVNVDPGKPYANAPEVSSKFEFISGELTEANKVWSDGANVTATSPVEVVVDPASGMVEVPTGLGSRIWTVPRTINVDDAAGLVAAVRDLRAGDTIRLAPGTYDVERLLGDMDPKFGGQKGWYLPLWQHGVTLKGAGSSLTTITSSVYSANEAWPSQDFISVWANSVRIEGVTLVPKTETNKAIEVMGKDFSLRDVRVMTNPSQTEKFGGSVYFNPVADVAGTAGDVGDSAIQNLFLDGGFLSASASRVTAGAIALEHLVIDWVGAFYAPDPYIEEYGPQYTYGPMNRNDAIQVVDDVQILVDDTVGDFERQIWSRINPGVDVRFAGCSAGVPKSVFTGCPADGTLSLSSEQSSPAGDPAYTWLFPYGTLNDSYDSTFMPGVTVAQSLNSPLLWGRTAFTITFEHRGALPGPASVKVYVGASNAGKTFTDAVLGSSHYEGVVSGDGYLTIPVSTTDKIYLIERPQYLVKFNTNGGGAVASQLVAAGDYITAPAKPQKLGYRFVGWYADRGLTDVWNVATHRVTGDTVLYAKYKLLPLTSLGTPVAPAKMSRSTAKTVYGSMSRHKSGTYPVRIYKERYVNGKWKSYGYVKAKVKNYGTGSRYSASVRLPYAGRWRLRAYAPADLDHSATWSRNYDYVTVK